MMATHTHTHTCAHTHRNTLWTYFTPFLFEEGDELPYNPSFLKTLVPFNERLLESDDMEVSMVIVSWAFRALLRTK